MPNSTVHAANVLVTLTGSGPAWFKVATGEKLVENLGSKQFLAKPQREFSRSATANILPTQALMRGVVSNKVISMSLKHVCHEGEKEKEEKKTTHTEEARFIFGSLLKEKKEAPSISLASP